MLRRTLATLVMMMMVAAGLIPSSNLWKATVAQSAGGFEPGVYAFEDYLFEDPNTYTFLKGGVVALKWRYVDSLGWGYTDPSQTPPSYSLEWYVRQIAGNRNGSGGQTRPDGRKMRVMLGIAPHDGDAQWIDPSGQSHGDQTPDWVYNNYSIPKVNFSIGASSYQFPKYTDGIDANGNVVGPTRYLNAVEAMVQRLAAYDGDPRIEQVWVGGGAYGESYPYPEGLDPTGGNAFLAAGITPKAWETYVSRLVGIYKKYFVTTPLFFSPGWHPRGGADHRRILADDAVKQGLHIAAHYLAAEPDTPFFSLAGFTGYYERWSWVKDYVQDALGLPERRRLYVESGENYNDQTLSYWEVLMARDKHADYFGAYKAQSRDPNLAPIFHWFNEYAGKTVQDTPGAWIAFRKESPGMWQPQKDGTHTVTSNTPSGPMTRNITLYANYGQWLTQHDPDNTTVALWHVGGKEGRFARRTDIASGRRSFYLKVDDSYISPAQGAVLSTAQRGQSVRIKVTYLDQGTGSFNVRYDGVGGADALAGTVARSGTGAWRTAVLDVADAYFGGRMLGGSDLRVEVLDVDIVLHMVEIMALAEQLFPLWP